MQEGSPLRISTEGVVHEATWMDRFLRSSTQFGRQPITRRHKRERSENVKDSQNSAKVEVRDAPLPLGPRMVETTSVREEEQLVQQLYGSDFCFGQDVWTERTVQRLCTGRWYENIMMMAVVEQLESQQVDGAVYSETDFMIGGWDCGRVYRRQTARAVRNAVSGTM